MGENLLKEIEKGSKMAVMKKKIITHYIYNGSSTITDLAREMDLSVPTVTKFIDEMCEEGYINDYGKLKPVGKTSQFVWFECRFRVFCRC